MESYGYVLFSSHGWPVRMHVCMFFDFFDLRFRPFQQDGVQFKALQIMTWIPSLARIQVLPSLPSITQHHSASQKGGLSGIQHILRPVCPGWWWSLSSHEIDMAKGLDVAQIVDSWRYTKWTGSTWVKLCQAMSTPLPDVGWCWMLDDPMV